MAMAQEQPASSPPNRWQRTCRWLKRVMLYLWGTAIGGYIIGVIIALSTTPGLSLSNLPLVHWVFSHPIPTILAAGGLLLLTIVALIGSRERKVSLVLSPEQQSRVAILKTLRKAYTDELAGSLQGLTRIPLRLHERFDLTHPERWITWKPRQPEQALPADTTIEDAYKDAGNGLVILGKPGAGKSTLLYDLAQSLITEAEQDESKPLPVILNLSSWAAEQLSLEGWLVKELNRHYGIQLSQRQLQPERLKLLPLFDGLDEVASSARENCIKAINNYHSKHPVRLVACCRIEEYQALPEQQRLRLQSVVAIRPLSSEQVRDYLADEEFEAVRTVMNNNPVLRELLTNPLMLSVVALTYKDKAAKNLPEHGPPKEQRQLIFEHYVARMLDPEEKPTREWCYTSDSTKKWLIWLAWQMIQHNQSEFYVEYIRLNWLSSSYLDRLPQFLKKFFSSLPLVEKVTPTIVKGRGRREYVIPVVQPLDEKASLTPNQGIWRSARNGLRWLVFECFIIVVLAANLLTQWLGENPLIEIFFVLLLSGGLYFSLIDGLGAFVDHFLVRFWLWRMGYLPWNLIAFLDEAADRLLLQRVGGGYRFIHPLFQQYFASLNITPPSTGIQQPPSPHP